LAGGDFDRVVDGARQVGDTNLWIDEQSEITLPEIRAKSRVFAQKHPKPLIVVDYLQRVAAHRQADPRVIIGEISTGLKNLAKELGAPVIALAQLNRELEKRTNKRPMMSDLGESGKIEQDADIILFIYRDEVYNADTKEPGITEVIAGKNRDGQVGIRKLAFSGRTLRYEDLSHV
jgi:replicative DNA helicase